MWPFTKTSMSTTADELELFESAKETLEWLDKIGEHQSLAGKEYSYVTRMRAIVRLYEEKYIEVKSFSNMMLP